MHIIIYVQGDPETISGINESAASNQAPVTDCDKAHRGLFLGLIVLVLTLVVVCCYFILRPDLAWNSFDQVSRFRDASDASVKSDETSAEQKDSAILMRDTSLSFANLLFFFTELSLLLLSTVAVILGFAKFRSLRFGDIEKDKLLAYLLLTAIGGLTSKLC